MILSIVIYAAIGIVAGIIGGLLGIGGGAIIVPSLVATFSYFGFPQIYVMHLAIGTSLAAMVINAFAAARAHHKKKGVLWDVVKQITPGIFLGSFLGALIARLLSSVVLEVLFGFFACAIGIFLLRQRKITPEEKRLPGFFPLTALGAGVACLANILGVGGGIFLVPLFLWYHMNEKKAIGTSIAITFLISLLGAIGYLFFGLGEITTSWSLGFIYLPAFAIIGITSYFAAPYGVELAHKLPTPLLRKIFAVSMIIVGLLMVF